MVGRVDLLSGAVEGLWVVPAWIDASGVEVYDNEERFCFCMTE